MCSDSVMSVGNGHSKLGPSAVYVFVVQYEENNSWVGLLSLSVLVQKLNHIQMQSQNLAV